MLGYSELVWNEHHRRPYLSTTEDPGHHEAGLKHERREVRIGPVRAQSLGQLTIDHTMAGDAASGDPVTHR